MTKSPMARALALASRGRCNTSPNPMVGAVVVNATTGQILGEGYHHRAGEPHAELLALRQAGDQSRGQSLYVTLEPCNHTGLTPPCTDAVIAAQIRSVHVAVLDPNPKVSGGGIEKLRQAGITVRVGEFAEAAYALNLPFFTWALYHRPLVILKSAMSLDGKVATATGQSKYLTHAAALALAHEQRRQADAILVGLGTVLADDPSLTYRGRRRGRDPVRVVLDSQGHTPPEARLFHHGSPAPSLVLTTDRASRAWERDIFTAGGEVVRLPEDPSGRISLTAVMEELAERRLDRLLVEGGPTVHSAFIQAGLADQWIGFLAPLIIGASGLSAVGGGYAWLSEAPGLAIRKIRKLGEDGVIEADFLASPVLQLPLSLVEEA